MGVEVTVIGGGASGLVAAWSAASAGASVTLLEKTDRLGSKVLMSGGGRCNATHVGTVEQLVAAYRPKEGRFLRPALYRFSNEALAAQLAERGVQLDPREDGRLFPASGSSRDVLQALEGMARDAGVEVRLNAAAEAIAAADGRVAGVAVEGATLPAERVILATGGSSYPKTGTSGDGWRWAAALGHAIVPLRAALAPFYLDFLAAPPRSGVALRGCVLKARQEGKEFARRREDLLFSHRGITGPATLDISREVAERLPAGPVTVEVDVCPDQGFEQLSAALRAWSEANPRKTVGAFVDQVVPHSLVAHILDAGEVSCQTFAGQLGRKAGNRLVETLKGWRLGTVRSVPLELGEVVAGGVSLDEVDPQTMASKTVAGLWLCGEVLDVAGPVGGYNLQAAFSTGFLAGQSAAG